MTRETGSRDGEGTALASRGVIRPGGAETRRPAAAAPPPGDSRRRLEERGFGRLVRICRERGVPDEMLTQEYARRSGVEIRAQADGTEAVVRVMGVIDDWWGFDPQEVVRRLDREDPRSIRVLLDTPGGSIDLAHILYADLRARARRGVRVATEVRGIAFSAGASLFLAGTERIVTAGISQLMVHSPWSIALLLGSLEEMEGQWLEIRSGLAAAERMYADVLTERTGATAETAAQWMATDTYFGAAEALEAGFATELQADADAPAQDAQALAEADRARAGALGRRVLRRAMTDAMLRG